MPKISVIMPVYDGELFVQQAIDSLLAQSFQGWELIVVDDGSKDRTPQILEQYTDQRITVIRQANRGEAGARNTGMRHMTGEYMAFLDADDTWEARKLEKQIAVFNSDPEVGLVHCGMREFDDETGETIATHLHGAEGWMADAKEAIVINLRLG